MTDQFLVRCAKATTIRSKSTGMRKNIEACDITVSKLVRGPYRCFNCPTAPGTVQHQIIWNAGDMLLHCVDHKIAGLRVPDYGLKKLAAWAVKEFE